ncbi:MAG: trimethylamine methyltransferase family protein [Paracoccaceae bacterium]|jgi:trimethylamine--corrinoid protein Co-methyltransferase
MTAPRRRLRRARNASGDAQSLAILASPYIQRKLPFYDPLCEEDLIKLEGQVDWLLENIGIEYRDDPEALKIWKRAGADVQGTRVKTDAQMIRELCAKAPNKFTQLARNRDRSVEIGGTSQVFAPVYGSPFVRDLKDGRRYGDLAAFEQLVKLTYMLPSLHHGGFVTCEPCDVPVSKRHLDMLFTHMTCSDKPHLGAITEMSRAQDSIDMAEIVFGREVMGENCVIMGNINCNSPLLVDKVASEAIRVYAQRGQGVVLVPFILSGAMGPVSTAASITQAMAEAMSCCAFGQLIRPGSPFVLGNFLSSMSLKTGAPTFGMPEPTLSNYVVGQLTRRLGLPLRCGGSLTASKTADAQAAYESADSMHSTMMAGSHFTLHAAGWLEGGLATGFEKLVMDADRLGGYQKVLAGLDVSDHAMARDAYTEVEPGGHFLGCANTMSNYKTAFYDPVLTNSDNVEQWEEQGSKDMESRAYERWTSMLKAYEMPPMEQSVRDELVAYMSKRKSELPDAWY